MPAVDSLLPLILGATAGLLPFLFRTPWSLAAAILGIALIPLLWYAFSVPRNWLLFFFGALILLPPLPLPGGTAGPHASALLAGIGLLAGLARAKEWRIELTALNFSLIAFLSALAISLAFVLLNAGWETAAGSAARVVLFSLAVYVFFAASQGPDRAPPYVAEAMLKPLFLLAALAALFGCVDFVFQLPAPAGYSAQFLWLDSGVYRRAQGLFYEAGTLGNFCAFFLVMSVACLLGAGKRAIPKWAASLGVVVFSTTILLSFSRSSALAAVVSCGTLLFLERRSWANRRAMMGLGVLLIVAVVVFAVFLPEFASGYWQRLAANLDDVAGSPDRVLSGRLETWRTLAGFITDHPWRTMVGIGYKTLPNTEYLGKPLIADNMYLSTLVETGLGGLLALLALNIAILRVSWKALKSGSFWGKWMFCFWLGEMFQMFSADVLTYWRVLPIYFWVLAQI